MVIGEEDSGGGMIIGVDGIDGDRWDHRRFVFCFSFPFRLSRV